MADDTKDLANLSDSDQVILSAAVDEAGGDVTARANLARAVKTQFDMAAWASGESEGMYPVMLPDGTIMNISSPKRIVEDAIAHSNNEDPGDFTLIFENKLI